MSKDLIIRTLLLFVFFSNAHAQSDLDEDKPMASKEFRPSIGLGMGMLNYYGEVNSNKNHGSFQNQFGYTIHISRKVNNSMDLGFSFLTGTILGNERSLERNLNFKTSIYSGSVYISYNFSNFLPEKSILQPYITLGFESFEYNNKSDLVDASGNKYFYWTDGTIRSLDQQSASASQAVLMKRDYVYETDLRAANLDGLGKYPQISIGIPLGLGINMRVSDRLNFKIGSTFHFTFTDLIDNVSPKGTGVRQGNSTSDYFVFNSISLHYDLLNTPRRVNLADFNFPDFFMLDIADQDNDGVVDGLDICPFTPKGAKVDDNGCPIDSDNDGVPDYMDKEVATLDSSFVNSVGVTLSDEDFKNQHLRYLDSVDVPLDVLYRISSKPYKTATYRILLGDFSGRLPVDLAKDFLDEGDVFGALTKKGTTAYLAGKYSDINLARKRQKELLAKGMPQATIVIWEGNHFVSVEKWKKESDKEMNELYKDEIKNKNDLNGMYAIKLGNTSVDESTVGKLKYFEYEDVVVLEGENNSTDYVIGPFIDSVGASHILQEVDRDKFSEATIVKVRSGKATESGLNTDEIPFKDNPKGASAWNSKQSKKQAKTKKLLSILEDSYIIDFGSIKDPKTKAVINEIKQKAAVVEVIDSQNGNIKLITKDRKIKSVAEAELQALKKQGITIAKVAKITNGEIVSVKPSRLKDPLKEKTLSKLEGAFVVDFGSKDSPGNQSQLDKLKSNLNIVEVVNPKDGSVILINENPKTKEIAFAEVEKLQLEGISTAKVSQVKNGQIIPVKSSELKKIKQDAILNNLENAFLIDFGSMKNLKTKDLIEKIKSKVDVFEIIDSKNGSTKLISIDPKTKNIAEEEVEKLKSEGILSAKVARVKNGEIILLKESELSKPPSEDLTKLENEFVVKIGTIDKKTSQTKREKLLNIPNTLKKKNDDGSIDIVTKLSHKQEEPAHAEKAKYKKQGFIDPKVAYVKEGKVEVLKKEALDGKFTLSLGSFKSNVPNEQVNEIASIADVASIETFNPDITTYTVGNFDNPEASKKRIEDLVSQGFKPELVKYEDGKIKIIDLSSIFDKKEIKELDDLKPEIGLVKTGGVVFRVQLGAYRGKINETVFRGVKTLAFPTAGGITKYVTGSFSTYQQSYINKLEMKQLGFSGAFVVAYKDGRRILVTDLVNKDKYEQVKQSVSPIEKELMKVHDKTNKNKVALGINENNNIRYRVQIGAFKEDSIQDKLNEFPDVTMEVYGLYKRYISGNFKTYELASKHKKDVVGKGFEGAVIVAYNGEERVAAPGENTNVIKSTDLLDVAKSNPVDTEYDKSKLMIMVQVGLYRGDIPDDLKALFNTLPSITKQITPHGVVRYMTGDFKTLSEAAAYKENLVKQGFEGSFLVAYYDNERINIQQAIKISQGN